MEVPPVVIYFIWDQWEFQDPKMEVWYHIRPYFVGVSPYIALKNWPYIYIYIYIYIYMYLQFKFLKWPKKTGCSMKFLPTYARSLGVAMGNPPSRPKSVSKWTATRSR